VSDYRRTNLENVRIYGPSPYNIAVIHGGPGAAGEMAPVARELAAKWGVLEPLQTAASLEGQVEELRAVLEKEGDIPVTLIGFSWGAWLGFIVTAKYPTLVKKLILIGCGAFGDEYAAQTQQTRQSRLTETERNELKSLVIALNDPTVKDKDISFARLGALASKADTYAPLQSASDEPDEIIINSDIFKRIWQDADELRRSGKLLELGYHIKCPVVAIHGDYDPHPAEGVQKPLSVILSDFRIILLKNCGHKPWVERDAKDGFYEVLKGELL